MNEKLGKLFSDTAIDFIVDEDYIVTLSGEVDDWQTVVDMGHHAANIEGVINVVNDIRAKGVHIPKQDYESVAKKGLAKGSIRDADVVIIGAGISGAGISRELAKYDLNIIVVEKGEDICVGTTKCNNGDIHPGNAVKTDTLKRVLNVKGNPMYDQWAEDLGFVLERCGVNYAVYSEKYVPLVEMANEICQKHDVPFISYTSEELYKEDSTLPEGALCGGRLPSMGIVEPYEVVVALAENAVDNGVEYLLNTQVVDVLTNEKGVVGVVTNKGIIRAKYVINAAGVYADDIAEMAGDKFFTIHPRRGTIAILDKSTKPMFKSITGLIGHEKYKIIEPLSAKKNSESKGGGMTKTPEQNILLGPSATETPYKDDLSVSEEDLEYAIARSYNPDIGYGDVITFFSNVRAADYKEDFIIGMSKKVHGFINCAAIQSPGLASAPAIAEMVENIVCEDIKQQGGEVKIKKDFNPIGKKKKRFRKLSHEEQDKLIAENPKYGRVVCRCELITEGEILDAIHSNIVPTTIDGIKRRTRAGMGRCQGGFCQPKVLEILARELNKEWTDINLKQDGSYILTENNRK